MIDVDKGRRDDEEELHGEAFAARALCSSTPKPSWPGLFFSPATTAGRDIRLADLTICNRR
jgi:hypothetical protein